MGFNSAGFGIATIVAIFSIAIVFVGPLLKSKFPKYKQITNTWFFWAAIAALCFIWLVVFRFADAWKELKTQLDIYEGDYKALAAKGGSWYISKAWLLDVCPFCGLGMCVMLILDPTRKVARSFAPLCFIGGAITIASLAFTNDASFTAQFIFIGVGNNKCYCIMHTIQVLLALGVWANTPSYGWKGWLAAIVATCLYYSYVAIMMASTGVHELVSGLSIDDWLPGGEYQFVSQIFGFSPQVCQIIGIPILGMVGCGIVALKDYVFNKSIWRYGNAYSGKWYAWYNTNKFVKIKFI